LDACLSLSSAGAIPASFLQDNESSEKERKFKELPPNKTKLLATLEQATSFLSFPFLLINKHVRI
jgi:hypothetical protein